MSVLTRRNPVLSHDEGSEETSSYVRFTFSRQIGPPLSLHLGLFPGFVEVADVVVVCGWKGLVTDAVLLGHRFLLFLPLFRWIG